MEFVLKRSNPAKQVTGLALVVALHVLIAVAFMNGLVRHALAPQPETTYITPIDPMPPKPPEPVQRTELPVVRSPFMPPIVDAPIPIIDQVPTITTDPVAPAVPPDRQVAGLQLPVNERVTPSNNIGIACPNSQSVRSGMRYPPQARREGLQGDVVARFVVAANGDIRNVNIVSSSNRAFNSAVVNAVGQFSCVAQGRDVMVEVPFSFRLE